ncbi:MAG: lipoate--protein ligase family protein [Bacteroidota bacterium]|nr:lipoate--protein ligase family protein [Bacteroidota bacterium]
MKRQWQFINSGWCSGEYNMQFDVALATNLLEKGGMPVLRVYGWEPYAISLGYHQRRHDFDETKCRDMGIDIVRRPTGGRAILHADELTYCVVMESERKNISESYREISRALERGLRILGADVEYVSSQPNFSSLYRQQTSLPCFTSSARYEIRHNGKKLVGSAQRRYSSNGREVILQHGSILLGSAHRRLSELLKVESLEIQAIIEHELESKTTDLSEVLGRTVTFEETAYAVKTGFESEWEIGFIESEVAVEQH